MKKSILLLALCLSLLLCGCGADTQPTEPPATVPTAAPTQAVTEPTETEPQVPHVVFEEGTLFLGDAMLGNFLSEYLLANNLINGAQYMTVQDVSAFSFLRTINQSDEDVCSRELMGRTWQEVFSGSGRRYQQIFLLLSAANDRNATVSAYLTVLDYLTQRCPDATIYVMTYPEATQSGQQNNSLIRSACNRYSSSGRVVCIDTGAAVGGRMAGSNLVSQSGMEAWYEAIATVIGSN